MSNTSETYILNHDLICKREVPSAITGSETPLTFHDWLKSGPEFHEIWDVLLKPIGPGVRFVTYLHRSYWGAEFDEILEYCPQIKYRNETVSITQEGKIRVLNKRYSFGSDFPAGYDSCLTDIDCPGWQFFSYDEMNVFVKGIKKFLEAQESTYEPEWQEIMIDHEKHEYDLFLFLHVF